MATERIYLGHDNTIDLILKADGNAQDLSGATKIAISLGGVTIESIDKATGEITWDQAGYQTGEIRIDVGNNSNLAGLAGNSYDAEITVFDASNPNGIAWGVIRVEVIEDYY